MRASCSRIYIHLIWATWDRLDLIDDKLEPIFGQLYRNKMQAAKWFTAANWRDPQSHSPVGEITSSDKYWTIC